MNYKIIDYNYGLEKEEEIIEQLNIFFNKKFKKGKKYKRYDFKKDNIYIELKSRRIKINKYKTTFICKSKLLEAEKKYKKGKTFYYVFNFIDGIYYINYNKNREYLISRPFKKIKIYRGDIVENIEIDINKLLKLNNLNIININEKSKYF